jgi:membrane protease YdiL (CAAX protease family)
MSPVQESRGLIILLAFLMLRLCVAAIWKRLFHFQYHVTMTFVMFLLSVFLVMSVGVVYLGMQVWVGVELERWWFSPGHLLGDVLSAILTLLAIGSVFLLGGKLAWRCGVRPTVAPRQQSSPSLSLSHPIGRGLLGIFFGFAIASFQEETLFRGWLQCILIARWDTWWGIVGQAIVFAGSHFGMESLTSLRKDSLIFLARVALGILLGWLTFSRGTLLAAGIVHGILG